MNMTWHGYKTPPDDQGTSKYLICYDHKWLKC